MWKTDGASVVYRILNRPDWRLRRISRITSSPVICRALAGCCSAISTTIVSRARGNNAHRSTPERIRRPCIDRTMENTQLTTMIEAHIAQGIPEEQAAQPLPHRRKPRINVGANERALSVVGGSMLAAFGLRRGGWAGTALAALGGELIWRGATGHCVGYESLGIDRLHGSGPVRVSETVRINR